MKVLFVAGRWAQNIERSQKLKELQKIVEVEIIDSVDEKILRDRSKDAEIIITGGQIAASVINASKKLKLIQTTSVGYEYIDDAAAAVNGVIICNVAGVNANSVAELAFGMILNVSRGITSHNQSLRKGIWERIEPENQVEIRNSTIGIIGLGNIGSRMAQLASYGFNMNVLSYDPYITEARAQQFNAKLVDMEILLKNSDIVTVHVPLNKETYHLVGDKEFRLMKLTAIFVNTSRGQVVDEKALIKVLSERRIRGACLDVYEVEPLPKDSPLLGLDNVCCVPHIGSTPHMLAELRETAIWNVIRVARGQQPMNIQNPKTYYTSPKWGN